MVNFEQTRSTILYSLRSPAVRYGLAASLVATVCCLFIALVWWTPAKREQGQLTRRIQAARKAQSEAQHLEQLIRAQQQVLPQVSALERKAQARATQSDLIQGIARLAAHRGVRVISQAFEEGKAQSNQNEPLFLEIGFVGDYEALRHLSGDLATLPMWIEVMEERLELAGQGSAQVKAQLRLLTFRGTKEPA